MNKFAALLCLTMCAPAQTKTVEGDWQGTLSAGSLKIRIGLHLSKDAAGDLTAKVDSIDQSVMGIAVKTVTLKGNRLTLDIPAMHGGFEGTLNTDGSQIAGTLTQGAALPLTFKRVDKVATLNRPQEPKPPFPYDAVDVAYENNGIKLAGTLTVPRGAGPFPAAVLITGSGPQDRDEALFGHKPFWVIADHLTRHGIAVLRLDDRGVGQSTGNSTMIGVEEMAGDVLAGVHFMKSRKEIDGGRIGLIGHSEGGIVGPLAASQSPDVAFVVMLAGTGVNGEQVLYLQSEMVIRSMGGGDAAVKQNRKLQELLFGVLHQEKDEKDRQVMIQKFRDAWKADRGADAPKEMEAQFAGITSPEMMSFVLFDPAEALRKVKVPVLAMNGSRDVQVPPVQNLPAIVSALTAAGNPDVTAIELPGLNHLFQHCKTCAPTEYGVLEETFSYEALEIMTDWITRHMGK
jgi:pimeloyl-ACP methyl ester carboxylesterase